MMKVYLVYLIMDDETLEAANVYGQYEEVRKSKLIQGLHCCFWGFTVNKSLLDEFLEYRQTKDRYYIKKVSMGEREYGDFIIRNYNNEILPGAICTTVATSEEREMGEPYPVFTVYSEKKHKDSNYVRLVMTKREYDFVISNESEVKQETIYNFFKEYEDKVPPDIRIFTEEVQDILVKIGYAIDVMTFNQEAILIMNEDEEYHQMYEAFLGIGDGVSAGMVYADYSELQLFLIIYRDIIY